MFSSSRFHGKSPKCWKTTAISGRGRVTGWPSISTSPWSRPMRQSMILSRVVLPQPLGPNTQTLSLAATSRLISCNAITAPPLSVLVRFWITILPIEELYGDVFEQLFDSSKEPRADRAVNHAVVGGKGCCHRVFDRQHFFFHHDSRRDPTGGQDRALR